ncbi:hypothetical protein ACT3RR_15615 [Ewingella sp. AOP8-B2-18]
MNDAQAWLHWWTEGYWQQAEESWHSLAFFQQPESLIARLQSIDPQLIARQLGIEARLPSAPHTLTLKLLALTAQQQSLALRLTAEICGIYSPEANEQLLPEEARLWSKRISRALRPGLWLPENLTSPWQVTILLLLRHVLPIGCWQRVRFLFPQPWIIACEAEQGAELAANKLLPLWEAALWRASLPVALASGPAQETQDVAA